MATASRPFSCEDAASGESGGASRAGTTAIQIRRSNALAVSCQVRQRGDDLGYLGTGGVVGLYVDKAHVAILIHDQHRGSAQADGSLGVDAGQVETELAWAAKTSSACSNAMPIRSARRLSQDA